MFGREIHKLIQNKRIICSGTIWGTADNFYEFSKLMWEQYKNNKNLGWLLSDQAVANYLIYYKKIFNDYSLIESDNINGRIMTIALTKNIKLDSKNNILNCKGEIAAVVHQYERKSYLKKIVRKKYCYSNIGKKVKKSPSPFSRFLTLMRLRKLFLFTIIFFVFVVLLKVIVYYRNRKRRGKGGKKD